GEEGGRAGDGGGCGRSGGWDGAYDADPDPFRILNMVRDAMGLVFALGYREVAGVVGHDAGSPVAAWSALIRPDVFRSVTMMSSPFAGVPSLPFNTANGAQLPRPAQTHDELGARIAKLSPPRKYYQNYQRARNINPRCRSACSSRIGITTERGSSLGSIGSR